MDYDCTNKDQLKAAINHELHHLVRWQNAGCGSSLGEAILSEGLAAYYERLRSGWYSPWSQAPFTKEHAAQALGEWQNDHYDHAQWFFEGSLGKWIGYGLGTALAEKLYSERFSLEDSLQIIAADTRETFKSLK